MEIRSGTVPSAREREDNDQSKKRESREFQKSSAGANSTVIQPREEHRDNQPEYDVGQIHGVIAHTIKFDGVERGKQVTGNPSGGQRFERASQKVGQEHHPAGYEADGLGEKSGGVGDFSPRIGDGNH